MLQQTQVPRVVSKYQEWLDVFPTLEALANAATAEVLQTWKGLGYNSRAVRFKAAAQSVVQHHNGKVPRGYQELISLPGVGSYTAGAIQAFAWNIFTPILETNIRTVCIHHLVLEDSITNLELLKLVERYSDQANPRAWYTALMDYGTYLKSQGVRTNSRVAGYRKQPAFKGSIREARALILDAVTHGPVIVLPKHTRQKEALESLIKEGLVEVRSGQTVLVP